MIRRPPRSTLFPYTRSSDLPVRTADCAPWYEFCGAPDPPWKRRFHKTQDRKSTRLNSSHRCISYAVFCLKKKKNKEQRREKQHSHCNISRKVEMSCVQLRNT